MGINQLPVYLHVLFLFIVWPRHISNHWRSPSKAHSPAAAAAVRLVNQHRAERDDFIIARVKRASLISVA